MTSPVRARLARVQWLPHLVMWPLVFISVFPVYWMIVSSFRPESEILVPSLWPSAPTLGNYVFAIGAIPVGRMLFNTFVFATIASFAQIATAVLAAYSFARWRFPLDRLLYTLVALTWLVPFQVVMVPNYLLIANMGLIDTIPGLVLPNIASAFAVLLLVQAMRSFPRDIIEAAHMDGASHLKVLWRVILPNLRAPLAALCILKFITNWNEYFWPLLLTRTEKSTVIQIGLQMFLTEEGDLWGPLMAVSTLACLPILIVYAILQRQVIDSFIKAGVR